MKPLRNSLANTVLSVRRQRRHWKSIELATDEDRIEWLNSMVFRGMAALPLRVVR